MTQPTFLTDPAPGACFSSFEAVGGLRFGKTSDQTTDPGWLYGDAGSSDALPTQRNSPAMGRRILDGLADGLLWACSTMLASC